MSAYYDRNKNDLINAISGVSNLLDSYGDLLGKDPYNTIQALISEAECFIESADEVVVERDELEAKS